jgi:chromosome segregation ATPase
MVDALAQRIGLTDAEKAATRKAMEAKREAATALGQELRALAQVVSNKQSKDEELTAALKKFDAARTAYRQKVKDIDAQLAGAVSLRARAALTVAGVIDNGFGARFGGMRAGGARAGGARGFAPRTGARGAAGQ